MFDVSAGAGVDHDCGVLYQGLIGGGCQWAERASEAVFSIVICVCARLGSILLEV